MYSLVSASVLALDLVRHPSGAAVAHVVDRVLCLSEADVVALAAAAAPSPARDAARTRLLAATAGATRMSTLLRGVRASVSESLPDAEGARLLVDVLSETLLGSLGDLLALLRREQPLCGAHLPEAGVQAALDAVAVAWAGRTEGVDLAELGLLRAPWAAALSPVPVALPEDAYGAGGPALRALLEQVSRFGVAQWESVEQAHWERQGNLRWSQAMHAACQAAADADRLVEVARAQLAAARALRLSGASTAAGATGVAMAVTAAVQATCVTGLVDDVTAGTLLQAWRAGCAA